MNRTDIEWTDWSVNPIKLRLPSGKTVNACIKCSPGCQHCYAESVTRHWWPKSAGAFPGYSLPLMKSGEIVLMEKELQALLRLDARIVAGKADAKLNKVFWGDMTDLFGDWVPDAMVDRCFAVMALTPRLIHQVLTKRPERMARYLAQTFDVDRLLGMLRGVGHPWNGLEIAANNWISGGHWMLPNVWLGTSVENQEWADKRIPHLLRCPAAVRFLSIEPMLGPINLDQPRCEIHDREFAVDNDYYGEICSECAADGSTGEMPHNVWLDACADANQSGINWVIVGGESGPHARPMHPDWVRSLRDQCHAAGVAFFFKQWGEWAPGECVKRKSGYVKTAHYFDDRWSFGRENLAKTDGHVDDQPDAYRVGKKAAGRLLDGVEHNEFLEGVAAKQ